MMMKNNLRLIVVAVLGTIVFLGGCDDKKPQRSNEKKKPEGYFETVIHSKTVTETRMCQVRLRSLGQELRLYAAAEGKFPPSLADLKNPNLIKSPMRPNPEYLYIAGQSPNMPPRNILVYLEQTNHENKCHVLYIDGTTASLSPEALKKALDNDK